jgi:hypothetical protein
MTSAARRPGIAADELGKLLDLIAGPDRIVLDPLGPESSQ